MKVEIAVKKITITPYYDKNILFEQTWSSSPKDAFF